MTARPRECHRHAATGARAPPPAGREAGPRGRAEELRASSRPRARRIRAVASAQAPARSGAHGTTAERAKPRASRACARCSRLRAEEAGGASGRAVGGPPRQGRRLLALLDAPRMHRRLHSRVMASASRCVNRLSGGPRQAREVLTRAVRFRSAIPLLYIGLGIAAPRSCCGRRRRRASGTLADKDGTTTSKGKTSPGEMLERHTLRPRAPREDGPTSTNLGVVSVRGS